MEKRIYERYWVKSNKSRKQRSFRRLNRRSKLFSVVVILTLEVRGLVDLGAESAMRSAQHKQLEQQFSSLRKRGFVEREAIRQQHRVDATCVFVHVLFR